MKALRLILPLGACGVFVLASLHHTPIQPAHVPTVTASCAGVSVTLESYNPQGNTLRIVIDGTTVVNRSFGGSTSETVPNPDQTKSHTWRVVVVSSAEDGNVDQSGTIEKCKETPSTSPPTSAPVATSAAPSTTTSTPTLAPPVSSSTSASVPPVASSPASVATTTTSATATRAKPTLTLPGTR